VAGKDLGYAGPAQNASPPAPARRRPFWRELAVLLLLAAVLTVVIKAQAVIGRVFLVVWPPAQLREVPIPATFAQRALTAPPHRGMTPLPMAVGLAGMLPLAWACRRQTAHVPSERR
jgi:hypothetical protein